MGSSQNPRRVVLQKQFFDIPTSNDQADLNDGPATCPPPTEGWWSSSLMEPRSIPDNDIGQTPDWFSADQPAAGSLNSSGGIFNRLLAEDISEEAGGLQAGGERPTIVNRGVPGEPLRLPAPGLAPMHPHTSQSFGQPRPQLPTAGDRVVVHLADELGLQDSRRARSPGKARCRRRKESQDPVFDEDPFLWLPTATFV
eukprot:CAMPEP_0172821072 /NCGR_PEP_ID=MMETSP1075-20121228/15691_1 /TAXON_ID=2916 /ORGANISM="Ceratium fusus, Strain PA161109" /LENGTH=197 /DNA_ID=CAMNT_0013661837 /DNA_START=88 /DNA_END=678 /DNA_ORIENTATION=-